MGADAPRPDPRSFRRRLLDGAVVFGSFIKTPTGHATEILGDVGFDFVVIDEEHAPFDRGAIDNALLATRAAQIAGIVRVASPASILAALDSGAEGVLVPHISSAAKAREIAAACRYRGGRRGFSNSPRAGRYGGRATWDHVQTADETTLVMAMIEDPEALQEIEAIAAVEGIDAFFVGRGDLTVALNAPSMDAPPVRDAVTRIAAAARKAKKPLCAMVAQTADARWLRELGATAFIVSSDQGFMRQAATAALSEFRAEVT